MKITIKVDAQHAQYIAALIDFWEICEGEDPSDGIENQYAVRLLPALILDIGIGLNSIPWFWDNLSSLAQTHGWTKEEIAWLLRLKDNTLIPNDTTTAYVTKSA